MRPKTVARQTNEGLPFGSRFVALNRALTEPGSRRPNGGLVSGTVVLVGRDRADARTCTAIRVVCAPLSEIDFSCHSEDLTNPTVCEDATCANSDTIAAVRGLECADHDDWNSGGCPGFHYAP